MGVAIFNTYLALLFLLVHFRIVPWNGFWKASPFIVLVLLLFGLLIPMGWGAPQGSVIVVRNAVSIVPGTLLHRIVSAAEMRVDRSLSETPFCALMSISVNASE